MEQEKTLDAKEIQQENFAQEKSDEVLTEKELDKVAGGVTYVESVVNKKSNIVRTHGH